MELNDAQKDALVELINMGFGRAGAALSQLTGHRVMLDVPTIGIYPLSDLTTNLRNAVEGEIATVHQIFSGPVNGDAFLILDQPAAMTLKELLTDEPALPLPVDGSAREVVTEVGNILLNACLGSIANLLHVHVSFAVPRVTLDTLQDLISSLIVAREGLRYALVVRAGFRLRGSEVKGVLVIVLSVASLDRLLRAVQELEQG